MRKETFADIVTSRLRLRRLAPADAPALFRYRSQPEIFRFQLWEPRSVEQVSTFIEQQRSLDIDEPDTWFQLAMTLEPSGILVGDCGLHFPESHPGQAEIGITLDRDHQGKGYATEALTALLGFLFETLGKHRVFASTDPRNGSAIRLLRGVGMRQEAHFRESYRFKGDWADELVFAILRREWEASRSTRSRRPGSFTR